jgi:hypothetical protein
MVDASDEDGSSLSFNFGGVVASSWRPPSSWWPPLGLEMISPECPLPRVSLVIDLLFLGSSEGLDGVSREWPFYTWLGLHPLNTEERGTQTTARRGWAGPNGPASLGSSGLSFGPTFSTVHLLQFGSLAPSIVGFGRRYLRDQVEGFLCMNFQPFHLSPREFSIQGHWSLPPLEASWHVVGAPWLTCKTFSELDASFLI